MRSRLGLWGSGAGMLGGDEVRAAIAGLVLHGRDRL